MEGAMKPYNISAGLLSLRRVDKRLLIPASWAAWRQASQTMLAEMGVSARIFCV
jgi:hypothetical protein